LSKIAFDGEVRGERLEDGLTPMRSLHRGDA
jgi:hypothetical protein